MKRLTVVIVFALALVGLVSGFRRRAFEVGRGRAVYLTTLASSPVRYWTTAVVLSMICGGCLGVILFAATHR